MFAATDRPRVYALPPGVDFGAELVRGLELRAAGLVPEDFARIELFVNTQRMRRHLRDVWDAGPAKLLPLLRLVTDIASDPVPGAPPPVDPMARRFEVLRLVSALLDAEPEIAPRAALYDLAESLSGLMDEMEVEGVSPETVATLDGTELSEHWQTALRFLRIIEGVMEAGPPGPGGRQRARAEALAELWAESSPAHPLIVAGSTASRGATSVFMQAVSRLPQGALVLPGFDFDLPQRVWDGMDRALHAEDHPQFRFRQLLRQLGLSKSDVEPWTDAEPAHPGRNRLVSLSLRPAPVTDAWQVEGPELGDLTEATRGLTLVEAPSPRDEAETIALGLRAAVEDGRRAALVTPDRMLTRQVAAALDRWDIRPDDSAGQPLALSPPGRFLRQVLDLMTERLTAADLLALLKHPLCHGGADRNLHLLHTRELELHLRRHGPAYPDGESLRGWGHREKAKAGQAEWAEWLAARLDSRPAEADRTVPEHLAAHLALAEALSAGPAETHPLWDEAAGRKALELTQALARHGGAAGPMPPRDYATLFTGALSGEEVRDRDAGDPRVLIWGTLEARVTGADLVILGGLNDGTWPEAPPPDPWLNRKMRAEAGLTLPERRIGLSAHDYQQAVAGREVWITRAKRSDEAETVPSRWLNRLTNLLGGLEETGGPGALEEMRNRGDMWIAQAQALSAPTEEVTPARRPSPRPPVEARPKVISVTEVQRLIRDPYSVYARRVLGLNRLDPLVPEPDAPLRGIILHGALERFVREGPAPEDPGAFEALMQATEEALAEACPWPAHRRLWAARMARVAESFLTGEADRRERATPEFFEEDAKLPIPELDLIVTGKADRIDRLPDGRVALYDYKTGAPPSEKQQLAFDKQLLLEAAMTRRGAFASLGPAETALAEFIGLGSSPKVVPAPLEKLSPEQVWEEFLALMQAWRARERGYSASPLPYREDDVGDYDHLARRGEWDLADDYAPEDLE
ncbi:double-strand break repair protein AddB [Histidinibacterium aquaticum]|uniref:Double-strand break repair protein AddB n=1 Tax=Histidinibacterium aquaticum TaxID=2613962 RepID=A0A5J5GG36_9RHOB|nr:double-strand break repair protein AddB [Histidinibacterium aquaticum]